jgi:hypothetical protein
MGDVVMSGSSPAKVAMGIEHAIRSAYLADERRIFWPQQFVRDDLGDEEDVLGGLRWLAQSEKLVIRVTVQCPNGHDAWQGTPERMRSELPLACNQCGYRVDPERDNIYMHVEITPDWSRQLDMEARDSVKKKLRLSFRHRRGAR